MHSLHSALTIEAQHKQREAQLQKLPTITKRPCTHWDDRPDASDIRLLVIHNISLPPGQFGGNHIADFFQNKLDPKVHPYFAEIADRQVSSHFLIRRDGHVQQFVSTLNRAWHAGVSSWQGRERCNDFSVGIELEGDDETPFEAAQYATLQSLLKALATELPIKAVTSHSHVAPGRKTDPGPAFDWPRLRAALLTK